MPEDKVRAEISVQIDADGNLVLKGLDRDALENMRKRLESASETQRAVPTPKLRVEAIFG
jgi:hypothetical protein